MICKTLKRIWLLDQLQYWIDNWTPHNSHKRSVNFGWIHTELTYKNDYESADIAEKARRLSITLPFRELTERDIV